MSSFRRLAAAALLAIAAAVPAVHAVGQFVVSDASTAAGTTSKPPTGWPGA